MLHLRRDRAAHEAWTAKNQEACNAGPANADGTTNVAAGKDNSGYWQEYGYDDLGNRQWVANKDINGDKTKDVATEYDYGRANGSQPGTLTKVRKKFTTPEGAAVTAEAERLYELTGETKAVTSLTTGDKQELTWTYDGQVERVTGQGENGKTAYYGLGDKCLDLKSGLAQPGTVVQLYTCNATIAQKWTFTAVPNQATRTWARWPRTTPGACSRPRTPPAPRWRSRSATARQRSG